MLQMLATTAPLLLNSTIGSRAQAQRKRTVTGERIPQLDGLDRAMQAANIRAGALAVACMGKTFFEHGYTSADPSYPITQPKSPFRLASVSKAFAVALTYELVQARALTLDTHVFPYLDFYRHARKGRPIDPRFNDITVKQLIDNRGGLIHQPTDLREIAHALRLHRTPTFPEVVGYMLGERLLSTPGTAEHYSSFGRDLLAFVCAKAAGTDFFNALRKYVMDPLGIEAFPNDPFKRLPLEGFNDDPGRGPSLVHPDSNEILPYAYGGGVIVLEGAYGAGGVVASAGAVARLIGHYAAYGYGLRRVSGRGGSQSGTSSWAQSEGNRLDICYIFNTRHFGPGGDQVMNSMWDEIKRTLEESHIGCEVIVYPQENFGGKPLRTNNDDKRLPEGYNDQISSIRIVSGQWDFYEHYSFNGRALKLGPGEYARLDGGWNSIISSLRCIEPTLAQKDQSLSVDAGQCTRLSFRQTADMCNNCTAPPWNGELTRISDDEWMLSFVDGHNRAASARWRLVSANKSEMIFADGNRNLFTRFDLTTRTGWQRRGAAGPWVTTSAIVDSDCR
jgi:CubicO group peptidase (beta-lactamase class C family)